MSRAGRIRKLAKASPPEAALSQLSAAAQDADHDVREAAMFAFDRLPLNTAEHLAPALDDQDEWVRLRAAVGLAHRGDRRGLSVLLSHIESDDYDAVVQALDGLGALGERATLAAVINDPGAGPAVRKAAEHSLRRAP
jgi:HEAT repeat protein